MKVLLAAGAGVAVLGLIAFLIGYPISDTSFGNAMMIDGVIVLCTGLLIMALSVISRQLDRIATLLGGETAHQPLAGRPILNPDSLAEPTAPLFPAAETSAGNTAAEAAPPVVAAAPAEPVPEVSAPAERPRRNLLFESRRRDKPEKSSESKPAAPKPAEPLPAEPLKPSFDDAWSGGPLRKGQAETVSEAAQPASAPPVAAPPAAATVIKSGVVDGMAYSLYSDGSIEAHMPKEGLIRFASLDELRDYLENKP